MFEVRVPATTANLGPGFDSFGMAFQRYNTFTFEERDNGKLTIRGVKRQYQGKSNMVYQAMIKLFEAAKYIPKGLYIHCDSQIPFSRGLGSSASCILAGLVGANAICDYPFDDQDIYDMAVEIEGHPDNITPAMFGGLTVAFSDNGDNHFIKKNPHSDFYFCALVPNFGLSTKLARKVLPSKVTRKDAIFNVSRATMTYLALIEGDVTLLQASMEDKIHQPYRKDLIDGYDAIRTHALASGALNICLSGAGPTLLAITHKDSHHAFISKMETYLNDNYPAWGVHPLVPDTEGVVINEIYGE